MKKQLREASSSVAITLVLLAGCAQPVAFLEPPPPPPAPAPVEPPPAAPEQHRLEPLPEERKLEPLPVPARRVMVVVSERLDRNETAHRDSESESILSEKLLEPGAEPPLEVVRRGTYEEVLERDVESLALRGLADSSRVLSNLLKAGVDFVAIGEVGASEGPRDGAPGKAVSREVAVHAGIQLVRTDDATVKAVGNADSEGRTLREAKTKALTEAARKLVENMRSAPPGTGARSLTITVEGLSSFEEADRILKSLRGLPGVLGSRDLRFSAGPGSSGVARYEVAFGGNVAELQAKLAWLGPGLRLEATRVEGNRWSYRLARAEPGPAAPSGSTPAAGEGSRP